MTPYPIMVYVDTSAALAIAFQEEDWELTDRRLAGFPLRVSSNLLEAEMRSAYERDNLAFNINVMPSIGWVYPDRPLAQEMAKALSVGGYLKGADLWHIAVALYVEAAMSGKMAFITLDNKQREVAAKLGFET